MKSKRCTLGIRPLWDYPYTIAASSFVIKSLITTFFILFSGHFTMSSRSWVRCFVSTTFLCTSINYQGTQGKCGCVFSLDGNTYNISSLSSKRGARLAKRLGYRLEFFKYFRLSVTSLNASRDVTGEHPSEYSPSF